MLISVKLSRNACTRDIYTIDDDIKDNYIQDIYIRGIFNKNAYVKSIYILGISNKNIDTWNTSIENVCFAGDIYIKDTSFRNICGLVYKSNKFFM